jgi:DNA-binding CsgD family transcriptional regulator
VSTFGPISRSEHEVARMLCAGMRMREVADRRGTSLKTTKTEVASLRAKLGALTLAQLGFRYAQELAELARGLRADALEPVGLAEFLHGDPATVQAKMDAYHRDRTARSARAQ